jgi:hypothetical protein
VSLNERKANTDVTETPNFDVSDMEPLPDLGALSDEDLKSLIEALQRQEAEVSYRRRLLQGRIDILRAERTARFKDRAGVDADVDRLTDILASRGSAEPGEEPTS